MSRNRPRRSVLYMPGANARALEKARTLDVDCLIFDMEDAVAPEEKEVARERITAALEAGGYGSREIIVRINALDSPWGEADLGAAVGARPDAVLVPKVSGPADIERAGAALAATGAPGEIAIWAMMETPRAILNALAIADAGQGPAHRLAGFVMGTNDLAKETGARPEAERFALLSWLSTCVAAARAGGIAIIDGVYNDFRDTDGFESECEQGRALGMDGKTLIHPGQIAAANRVFSPGDAEIALAGKIVAAFDAPENAGKGVVVVEGRMVGRLHLEMARRTLAIAEVIAGRAKT